MTRFKKRKKYKVSLVWIFLISMILFFTIFLFNLYSKFANQKLINIASIKLNEMMKSVVSNNINYDLFKNASLDDLLVINKNSSDEIIYASFNLDKSYQVLDLVTKEINNILKNYKDNYYIEVPLFISNNNILISSLGPNIYVPIKFLDETVTNIKTKITDYGLNNALVEIYVTISLKSNLISPFVNKTVELNYDALIASSVIQGRVPSIYNGSYLDTLK